MRTIAIKLKEAPGPAVALEMRIRLIGQFSQTIRESIKEIIKEWKAKNP
jgi:hypothetical protein